MRLELVFSEQLYGATGKTNQSSRENSGRNENSSGSGTIKFVFDDEQEKEKTSGSLSYTPSRSSHGGTLTMTLQGEYILDRTASNGEEGAGTDEGISLAEAMATTEEIVPRVRPPSHPHPSKREKSRETESRSQLRSAARYDSDFESEDNNYSDEFDET
jgi:hypothetical protein